MGRSRALGRVDRWVRLVSQHLALDRGRRAVSPSRVAVMGRAQVPRRGSMDRDPMVPVPSADRALVVSVRMDRGRGLDPGPTELRADPVRRAGLALVLGGLMDRDLRDRGGPAVLPVVALAVEPPGLGPRLRRLRLS